VPHADVPKFQSLEHSGLEMLNLYPTKVAASTKVP
jgi:hypothetical protein